MSTELTIQNLLPAIKKSKKIIPSEARTFIGIDFGTSTSVVSIAMLDPVKTIDIKTVWIDQLNSDGIGKMSSEKVPTVVAWHKNRLLIGKGAADLKYFKKRGVDVWYSFKMELGEDIGPKYCNSVVPSIRRPSDATKIFFQHLKSEIERFVKTNNMPQAIEYTVSIPASFEANQRNDLICALEAVAINVGRQSLIDEPNAAFLSYVVETNTDKTMEKLLVPPDYPLHLLVFDFGAGTCDISILEVGHDFNGLYSKNLSISRFNKLGGDDIDRLIARQILFNQLLAENNAREADFKTPQINRGIIPKLMKPAEELKIQICKSVALQYTLGGELPKLAQGEEEISIGVPAEINLPKRQLFLNKPSLSYGQFKGIMDVFLGTKKPTSSYEGQDEFVSIFNPIESAIKKANINKDEIDYVLLIGGSSKNPYVQSALSRYFSGSEILLPRDPQTHVSAGAAIHSLIHNGFGKNIIQPITSEPIMVVTKGGSLHTLVRGGTEIPSDIFVIDDLLTQRDGQRKIEIPICVSSAEKILHIATIESHDRNGFKADTPIKIKCQITADKRLLIEAIVNEQSYPVEPLNPLANKPLDYYERRIYEAEKQTNIDAERNGGIPGKISLIRLAEAYADAKKHLRAAETLETSNDLHPGSVSSDSIAFHYSRSGNREKAIDYYEKAYMENRSAHTAFNLAVTIGRDDPNRYQELMDNALKLDSHHPYSLYSYGEFLMLQLKEEKKGRELVKNAYNIFKGWFDHDNLDDDDYHRLIKCAVLLDDEETARKVKEKIPTGPDLPYGEENLPHSKGLTALSVRRG